MRNTPGPYHLYRTVRLAPGEERGRRRLMLELVLAKLMIFVQWLLLLIPRFLVA